ncbi:hypothetical protein ACEWY4_007587 [Coilia grayii]|uniref:SCAN box domain-containing protein n=1 Tax=Coilia grayii TaxID=363190 RepID=A0ABD1KGN7_9TELE
MQHQFQQLQLLVSTDNLHRRPPVDDDDDLQYPPAAKLRLPLDPESQPQCQGSPAQVLSQSASAVPERRRPATVSHSASPSAETPWPVNLYPPHYGYSPPKMSPYTEDEDIEHYLTTFERIALANQWPRHSWAVFLVPLLLGKARAAYVAMDIADARDYCKVKQAILAKYEIDPEAYHHRFRSMAVQDGETVKELQSRLRDLYYKWMCPSSKTKEEIGDTIILEQFLRMLNPELKVWVRCWCMIAVALSEHAGETIPAGGDVPALGTPYVIRGLMTRWSLWVVSVIGDSPPFISIDNTE